MYLVRNVLVSLCALYLSEASLELNSNELSDVQAPSYVPSYAKKTLTRTKSYGYGGTSYKKTAYSGTKTNSGTKIGYAGTKTGYTGTKTGYTGTKTGYTGTKTGYTGTKTTYNGTKSGSAAGASYSETKTWHTETGARPTFEDFSKNANMPYQQKCTPECQNSGICVDTNVCQCPAGFTGRLCEFERKLCTSLPPLPMNSHRRCSSELCTITCMKDHNFPDGTTAANLLCQEGIWRPARENQTAILDCVPQCEQPCQNGGVCLSVNTCQCPKDFRGPQCQYSVSVCDLPKLAFNGGYRMSGDGEKATYHLSCPPGFVFSSTPADTYVCHYATGVFVPQPFPHCKGEGEIIQLNMTKNYYEISSGGSSSWSSGSISLVEGGTDSHSQAGGPRGGPGGGAEALRVVEDRAPQAATCLSWAGAHYKTFDGLIYSFTSPCQHILLRDSHQHKYTIAVKHGACERKAYCPSELTIYLEDKPYVLKSTEDGLVEFRSSKNLIPIPASLPGIRVSMPTDHVIVNLDTAKIALQWDTNNIILIEGSVSIWNSTEGLCGTMDGDPHNDMLTREGVPAHTNIGFASSWKINQIGDICESSPMSGGACADAGDADVRRAGDFCRNIFTKYKFRKCSMVMDVRLLMEACKWDYCACTASLSPSECACSTVSVYAKECLRHGVEEMRNWRDADTCPMHCPEGKVYRACGPASQPSCTTPQVTAPDSACVEGCFCPEGLLLEGGKCVAQADCPCRIRNRVFPTGAVINKECNTCTCQAGSWACSSSPCGARCGAVGDPHYSTFDGRRYDFMGHCTYDLLVADNFTVQAENVACSGAITEAMNLAPYKGVGKPSCTKAVSLKYKGVSIHLKQLGITLVNGKEVTSLPVIVAGIKIRAASSIFLIVQLPNKVDIWWDGATRVFVDVPASFHGKTKGLCGTFNMNQNDDFLTPEGDIEQSTLAFANKWKTREFCDDTTLVEPDHPCVARIENKETAEKYCSKLKSKLFEPCHWYVDVEPYYKSCLYDMCACTGAVGQCLCPMLGDYAMACADAGVKIQWRYNVKECELPCTGGQKYTVCADSCVHTCSDVARSARELCKGRCVEGCACPDGQVLDDNGACVAVPQCPCFHKGLQFKAGYKEVRPGTRERELCTCVGARWDCVPATDVDVQNYPPAEDIRSNCSAVNHMEFTTCELATPLTCKNMHLPLTTPSSECRPGCQCKKGYVLDTGSKKCVLASECPCHHGGRSYPDGHTMQEDCNKCVCAHGNWSCTRRACAGVCGVWGDSHVSTFDAARYDFEGVCTYLLAKGCSGGSDEFSVEIQNVPCGTTGATCSKSLTLKVGRGNDEEVVSLTKDVPLPDLSKLKRIKLREAGAYVFLDVRSLGLTVQWDRGLRVYVRVEPMWRGRVKGLCGNYNADSRDDFQTPSSGGLAESNALIFVDSWKLRATCPKPNAVTDHCNQRPIRKDWARSVCGTMKAYPFTRCHSEVPPGPYIERCERDACACDSGADCACACAALAAYATHCAARGVTLHWRSQALCPMQCDEECSTYDACISPCPRETCDNTLYYSEVLTTCEGEPCVEGCKPNKTCPEGEVFTNSTHIECVPRARCKPLCMTLSDGRQLLEGEVIEEDACHECRCSKRTAVCTGQPCSTLPPAVTAPTMGTEPLKCVPGWTEYVSRQKPKRGLRGQAVETEPLPDKKDFKIDGPMCSPAKMKAIECRTIDGQKTAKETGLNVECSLERGLVCEEEGSCPDFEIRVLCQCDEAPEPFQCLNSSHPNNPDPTDCGQFYECTPDLLNPSKIHTVLKTCAPGTMYSAVKMVCDWPASVLQERPECGFTTPSTSTTEEPTTVPVNPCQPGQVLSQCAYPCNKLCEHYKYTLQQQGKCLNGEKCVPGCVDIAVANLTCASDKLRRDDHTCVPVKDCICNDNGEIVKPGAVIQKGCEKCQCLDNAMHCDYTNCTTVTVSTTNIETVTTPFVTIHLPVTTTGVPVTTTGVPVTTTSVPVTTTSVPVTTTSVPVTTIGVPVTTTGIPFTTYKPITPPINQPIIMLSTTTPPPDCNPDNYINLLWNGTNPPNAVFTASSIASEMFRPEYARLDGKAVSNAGSWSPQYSDRDQYIQVELPHSTAIYGVVVQGSPLYNQYVTSYELMYGDQPGVLSPVIGPGGKKKVLSGPPDHVTATRHLLNPPIDARVVRLTPLTWHDEIALRFELIGCEEPLPTTSVPTEAATTYEPLCQDDIGIKSGLPVDFIEVSSKPEDRKYLDITSERGWRPLYSTPGEWIMFDFTAPRNITGLKTSGSVTTYHVMYTSDLSTFNPVVLDDGSTKPFRASVGEFTTQVDFHRPIRARYLKVLPIEWDKLIEMRVEPVGCFEPYPSPPPRTEAPPPAGCAHCPGVTSQRCACAAPLYYSGDECVERNLCPCFEGFMPYQVGSTFRDAKCQDRICKLGGITSCTPQKECKCGPNLVPAPSAANCNCNCIPCPPGTRICPTSKICIPLDKWCDGLQDCPDDERDCTTTTITTTTTTLEPVVVTTVAPTAAATQTTTTTKAPPKQCPKVECPRGYLVIPVSKASSSRYTSGIPPPRPRQSYQRYYRGSKGGTKTGYAKGGYTKTSFAKGGFGSAPPTNHGFTLNKPATPTAAPISVEEECSVFKCVPPLAPIGKVTEPCAVLTCPKNYALKLDTTAVGNMCPQYVCVPPPERLMFCNMTGRTFNTFDGAEYKYDVCYHILARETRLDAWAVLVRKKCRDEGCKNELLISQDDQFIVVKPNMMIEYDNYEYSVEQTSKICFQRNSFNVHQLGSGLVIESRKYNFTVLFSKDGDVKIGVPKSSMGRIDGLCGAFDGDHSNDRRKPDGKVTASIEEFGRAWAKPGLPPGACKPRVIDDEKQKRIWQMCDVITQAPFTHCDKTLNLEKWRSICLEKVCECTEQLKNTSKPAVQCRCQVLEQMVAECLAGNSEVDRDLAGWRVMMDCPADCPPPLVHQDCYRLACEPACGGGACAGGAGGGACFPGCYCPAGMLRKGEMCLAPADCKDCTCTGVSTPAKLETFQGDELPPLANCTYLASRGTNQSEHHQYELYISNGPCEDNPNVCTKAIYLVVEKNVISITKNKDSNKLETMVNMEFIYQYPVKKDWLTITLVNGQDLQLLVPEVYVELSVKRSTLEWSLRLPSHIYSGHTDGLCASCGKELTALLTASGDLTDDVDVYGKSWQASPSALDLLNITDTCVDTPTPPPPTPCTPAPPENNPCYTVLDKDKFGACHALVDPLQFAQACAIELCEGGPACPVLARYAALCRDENVYLDWRGALCAMPCEEPLVYRPRVDCERTCDNHDLYEKHPEKCDQKPVEGCFCPEGKVRVNNTCIEPSKCFPCDVEKGHYAGDEWQEDACTRCTCSRLGTSCRTDVCSVPACPAGHDAVRTRAPPGQCCARALCVPKPKNATCVEPKKMECGFGQVLKLKQTADGCNEYSCECKPASECPSIPSANEVDILEPGMTRVVDDSGCCARVQFECRRETCPGAPECPKYQELKVDSPADKCCPVYSCELPKDKCLVTLQWEAASTGGERARDVPQVVLKDTDSTWADGPCRQCRCEPAAATTAARAQCGVTECAAVRSTAELVLTALPVPFACCPQAVPIACRDGDNVYKVGEKWNSSTDACESYSCVREGDNKLTKVTSRQTCDKKCQLGWKYFESSDSGATCCGACKPVSCVVDGRLRAPGEAWTSRDRCVNYTCVDVDGTLQLQMSNETCILPSEETRAQFVLNEVKTPGQCCKTYVPVACKVGDKVYKEGDSWPTDDPCKNMTCARDAARHLSHSARVQECVRACARGWRYAPAPARGPCCGKCEQEMCVVGDELKEPGSTWWSADNCTEYSCARAGESLLVSRAERACPDVSACPPQYLRQHACCPECRPPPAPLSEVCDPATKIGTCEPTAIPALDTVGMVRVHTDEHGLCVNQQTIAGLTECRGTCSSGTVYNNQTGVHDARCQCCQALRYSALTVSLQCADGARRPHRVPAPAQCACRTCGAPAKNPAAGSTRKVRSEDYDIPEMFNRFG